MRMLKNMRTCLNNLECTKSRLSFKYFKEIIIFFILFLFSFINHITLIIFLLSLLFFFSQKEIGAFKIILLVSLRGIINPGLAISFTGFLSYLKYLYLFLPSLYLLLHSNLIKSAKNKNINTILILYCILTIYITVQSMLFSTYPIVSIFKYLLYAFVFVSIIIGFSNTNIQEILIYFRVWLLLIFVFSLPLFFSKIGFLRNGRAFQGLINHPNIYGVFCTLLLSVILVSNYESNGFAIKSIYTLISLFCIYMSQSRTAMFSALIIILSYIFCSDKINLNIKISVFLMISFSIPIIFVVPKINGFISKFFLKGYTNIFFSRSGQIQSFIDKMNANALFGTGFLTPFIPNTQNFSFSFDYVVEDGNIFLATLGYVGIIGLFIFVCIYSFIFSRNSEKKYYILFLAPILISFGEMTFFSTNNMACLFYICYGIYFYAYKPKEIK